MFFPGTGLDPAGPLFEHRDWTVGLNPHCADFVDVMHTGGRILGFGTLKVLGHVDMYPNGGRTQPCCFFKLSSAAGQEGLWMLPSIDSFSVSIHVTLVCALQSDGHWSDCNVF